MSRHSRPDEWPRRRRPRYCRHLLTACAATCLAAADDAAAQGPTGAFSGEAGVLAESYGVTGREARRPGATLRSYAAPTFEWMGMRIGASFLWSTEQRFVAQPLNRYYLNPRWSWGQVHLGDWVPDVSRYTASSARLRGGGVELSPGPLRLVLVGGRAQEASDLSVFDAAPERTLLAGLVGLGERQRSFVEIGALRAVDTRAGADTLSAPPQENAVASLAAGTALFGGRLTLRGEGSGSVFSRDTRAAPVDSVGVPEWSERVFTPRISSRVDYAWTGEARVSGRRGSLGAQVEYVGPGFTTLGNPYFQNDRRETRLTGSLRLAGGRLSASGSAGLRRDNLAGDKTGTTRRNTGTLALTGVGGAWSVTTVTLLFNGMVRDADVARDPTNPQPGLRDSLELRNVTLAATLTQTLRFTRLGLKQHVVVSASAQRIDDRSARFDTLLDATARSLAAEYAVTLGELYQVSVRPAWQTFEGAAGSQDFTSVTGGVARRAPRSPLSASMSATYTPLDAGGQVRNDATFGYRINERHQLGGQLRMTTQRGGERPFTERVASLRLTRRW